jgi:hypothetical protein
MSRTQALLLVLACLLAAAWAARRVGPSLFADVRPHATVDGAAVPLSSHGVLSQAERLRTRLTSPPPFKPPSRNPFRFHEPSAPAASGLAARAHTGEGAAVLSTSQIEPPQQPERPEMQLVGVAEERGPDGRVVRTAIVSAMTQLFYAKEGERVLGRYEVVRIGADRAQLKDPDGQTFSLALR